MTYDEVGNAAVVSCGDKCYFSSEDMLTGCYQGFSFFDQSKESQGYVQIFERKFISSIKGWTQKYKMLTPNLLELIMRFEEDIDGQIAIIFYGSLMFVVMNRFGSMFDGKLDRKIEDQKKLIRKDVGLLRQEGDILIFS